MNKKLIIMLVAVATAGVMFARPGPGFHGGPRGFHGGPRMMMRGPGFHHHHHHCGWGIAGAVLGTAALVNSIVNPAPVVVSPAPVVVAPQPVYAAPAPVVTTTYAPVPVAAPVYYRRW